MEGESITASIMAPSQATSLDSFQIPRHQEPLRNASDSNSQDLDFEIIEDSNRIPIDSNANNAIPEIPARETKILKILLILQMNHLEKNQVQIRMMKKETVICPVKLPEDGRPQVEYFPDSGVAIYEADLTDRSDGYFSRASEYLQKTFAENDLDNLAIYDDLQLLRSRAIEFRKDRLNKERAKKRCVKSVFKSPNKIVPQTIPLDNGETQPLIEVFQESSNRFMFNVLNKKQYFDNRKNDFEVVVTHNPPQFWAVNDVQEIGNGRYMFVIDTTGSKGEVLVEIKEKNGSLIKTVTWVPRKIKQE
ncbi:unnamed protein product [Rhizophagus irregularis]|nr:unnamed protein product [Rhizophagus irregularis]